MVEIDLFVEDHAHELFISALIVRVLKEAGVPFIVHTRNAVGGHGRAITELKLYQRAVAKGVTGVLRPDLLVVAIDANCKGQVEARNQVIDHVDKALAGDLVVACPDPHVERWFFADTEAFRAVVGVPVSPGSAKCERGYYKKLLRDAVVRSGTLPTLGGLEFAEDIVDAMDLYKAGRNDPSLGALIDALRAFARRASGQT